MFIIDSSLNHVMGSRSSHLEAAYDCAAPDNIKSSKAVGANSHSNTSPPLTAQSAKQPPHLCSVSTFTEETINGLTDFGVTLNNSATHCEVESQPVQPAVTTIQSHIYSAREPIPLFSTTSSISNRIASDSETDSHRELLFPRTRTDNASCSFRTHVPGPRSYTGISKQYVAGPLSAVPRRHRTISERTCCRCCCCLAGFPLCARAELQRTNRLLLGKLQKIFEEELSECVCHCGCSRSRPTDLEYRNERSASCRRYGSSTSISIKENSRHQEYFHKKSLATKRIQQPIMTVASNWPCANAGDSEKRSSTTTLSIHTRKDTNSKEKNKNPATELRSRQHPSY